jgi:hypothetical protein
MEGEEDDIGWDGPNIRPPPVKHDSGGANRSRFGSDRRHHNNAPTQKHHRPPPGPGRHERVPARQDPRPNQPRGHRRDGRDRRAPPVEDLRGRIGQSKGSGSDHRHSSASNRDKDRQTSHAGHQVNLSPSSFRLLKKLGLNSICNR